MVKRSLPLSLATISEANSAPLKRSDDSSRVKSFEEEGERPVISTLFSRKTKLLREVSSGIRAVSSRRTSAWLTAESIFFERNRWRALYDRTLSPRLSTTLFSSLRPSTAPSMRPSS